MIVQVVKEGKEHSQGIAYLDDGTMIVVDGGKKHMGETIRGISYISATNSSRKNDIWKTEKLINLK